MSNKISAITSVIQRISRREWLYGVTAGLALTFIVYTVTFLWPKQVQYDYASEQTCTKTPTLLPGILTAKNTTSFNVSHAGQLQIAGKPFYAAQTCFSLIDVPKPSMSAQLQPFGVGLIAQRYAITTTELPTLQSARDGSKSALATTDSIELKISSSDTTFRYHVHTGEQRAACTTTSQTITCELTPLSLKQASSYDISVRRSIHEKEIDTIYQETITTVSPLSVSQSSIAPGSTVYDKPDSILLTTDKEISSAANITLRAGETEQAVTHEIDGTALRIIFSEALPREQKIRLDVGTILGLDASYLPSTYTLEFTTSGGPVITGINAANYGVDPAKTFFMSSDYRLASDQNLQDIISLTVGGKLVAFAARAEGGSIRLAPTASLPRCSEFTISVKAGLNNVHGVTSNTPWSYNSRTICRQVFSIGTSVQGRPITAYKFGSGSSLIVYMGATHGDEIASKYIMDSWVDDLEANFHEIPSHRSIVVIPMVSPDSVAAGTRVNARNVDLNRNFPAASWKSDVVIPGGQQLAGGGGSAPLSEPESKAIADYLTATNPRLVITFHSKGSLVIANESGDSLAIAQQYGKSVNYRILTESQLGSTFAHDTTGDMENWLLEQLNIPTVLIELRTHTTNEFGRHSSALWMTAGI